MENTEVKELLRKQLQLLAEQSQSAINGNELAQLTEAMIHVALTLATTNFMVDQAQLGECMIHQQKSRRERGEIMKQIDFYRAHKAYCKSKLKPDGTAGCEECCLRLYCYTPPCERTDSMMARVIKYLSNTHIGMVPHDDSDHYNCLPDRPCPCTMDMSSALGSSDRP